MHGYRIALLLGVMGCAGISGSTLTTRACAIDGVPSLEADRQVAVLNVTSPTKQTLRRWAPFIFKYGFRTGEDIHFSEDRRALARSLPAEIVEGHWIWLLGDGHRAFGQTVTHRYAAPGTYLITVAIRLPHGSSTFTFDASLVRVTR